jgi:Skp family chaperone for outer membrane proteins
MRCRAVVSTALVSVVMIGVPAFAETVIPMKGQSPEQIQMDVTQCQAQAKTAYDQALASASSSASTSTTSAAPPSGGRMRGAVTGAAAGAAAAEVRGNRYENYDKIDSDVQQEYRQNQAKDAAVAGAAVGGARQRQARREQQQVQQQQAQQQSSAATQSADAALQQAYSACLSGRGYSVTP